MNSNDLPVFKNDLSPDEQEQRDADFHREQLNEDKKRHGWNIFDGILDFIFLILDIFD